MDSFIGDLYEAAAYPSLWSAIPVKLAQLFDADRCIISVIDIRGGGAKFLGVTDNYGDPLLQEYRGFGHRQEFGDSSNGVHPGYSGPERAPELRQWKKVLELIKKLPAESGSYDLVRETHYVDSQSTSLVGLHRPKSSLPFAETDRQKLGALIRHITRAVQLTDRGHLAANLDQSASQEALERIGIATMAVDGTGLILFANGHANALFRKNSGLHSTNGRLSSDDPKSMERLLAFIQASTETAARSTQPGRGGGISIGRGEGRLPLTLLVVPFRPKTTRVGIPSPAALLFIRDPEMRMFSGRIVQDLFGLTSAQAALATRLTYGESLSEAAKSANISHHTARDYLKQIFAKTGTSRQSELVALLLRTVAVMGGR